MGAYKYTRVGHIKSVKVKAKVGHIRRLKRKVKPLGRVNYSVRRERLPEWRSD